MGIKHATRVAGTDISKSAIYGENHEIEGSTIVAADISDGAVTTNKIANGAVTAPKLAYPTYFFVKSGTSPIQFAHAIGQAPTGVVANPKALQPYSWAVNFDGTNITIYHSAMGSLTFLIIAWV